MELTIEVWAEEMNLGVISNMWYLNHMPPQQECKKTVLSLIGKETSANAVEMESLREVGGKPRERKVTGAERGRYFRKEGLVGMSHAAEVFVR